MTVHADFGSISKKPSGPGIIHFDVTQGCKPELLNSALLDLGLPLGAVFEAFSQLNIEHIVPMYSKKIREETFGSFLDFIHESCPLGQTGTLNDLVAHVRRAELHPISSALIQKTVELLGESLKKSCGKDGMAVALNGELLVYIFCHVVTFCVLIHEANPLEVSCTRLPLSWPPFWLPYGCSDVDVRGWTLALVEGLPSYEQEWPAPFADPVSLALLKTVASRFGPRGESLLLQSGTGVAQVHPEFPMLARALWCEPAVIATRAILGPSSEARVLPLIQIRCLLGQRIDILDLIRRVTNMGARMILTGQVMDQAAYPQTHLCLVASHADAEKIIAALLVTGEAFEVLTSSVEQHGLLHRTVSIPFGRGQKLQQCGVIEWLLGDKILRAEPVLADLSAIVATTGYAQEVVRGDVLAAWKKWRER
jgi:Protein of unknown function DUF111